MMSLCICLLAYLENHTSKLHNFLYMLSVAVAWSYSDNNAVHCVLPVLWMSCLPVSSQATEAKAMPVGCIVSDSSDGAELGSKSDVYNCLVGNC